MKDFFIALAFLSSLSIAAAILVGLLSILAGSEIELNKLWCGFMAAGVIITFAKVWNGLLDAIFES